MTQQLTDEELLNRLNAHPEIRNRLESTLLAVADEQNELGDAHAVEWRLIDEMREMGRASLQAWAQQKTERETLNRQEADGVWREGKKNSAGTAHLESLA